MDAKKLIKDLKAFKPGDPAPDWKLPEKIIEGLLVDPAASAKYIEERTSKVFNSRKEIGDHIKDFLKVSGMSRGNLSHFHSLVDLRTRKTELTKEREEESRRKREQALKFLDLALEVIMGYGSPYTVGKEHGYSHMTIYRKVRKELGRYDIQIKDLSAMTIPSRRALAAKIDKERRPEIYKSYEYRIPE